MGGRLPGELGTTIISCAAPTHRRYGPVEKETYPGAGSTVSRGSPPRAGRGADNELYGLTAEPRPIPLKVSRLLAASRCREGGGDPLSPSAARRDRLRSQGEGCGRISDPSVSPAGRAPPRTPGSPPPLLPPPQKRRHPRPPRQRWSAGRRAARPLLGGSSCEGTRLLSAGESAAEALPRRRAPPPPPSLSFHSARRGGQPPARPGLLPPVSARTGNGSALPRPPAPGSPARGSSAPRRSASFPCPLQAGAKGRRWCPPPLLLFLLLLRRPAPPPARRHQRLSRLQTQRGLAPTASPAPRARPRPHTGRPRPRPCRPRPAPARRAPDHRGGPPGR